MTHIHSLSKRAAAAAVALCLALTQACTPVDDVSAAPGTRTKQGAIGGAIAGGLVGIASQRGGTSQDQLQGALLGALGGAAVGAAVGANLDKQSAELRRSLDSQIDVQNKGDYIAVNAPGSLLFAFDSDQLSSDGQRNLRSLAGNLATYPDSTIEVVGHTDNVGSEEYNNNLSVRRANNVSNVLQSNGVSTGRLVAYGRGERIPIATNDTAAGRQANRRVEINIRPTG